MKVSFSISDDVGTRLKPVAKDLADGNESLLVDVAIQRLLELTREEITRLVARRRLDRMATTRDGWNRAFWSVLGDEFGWQDSIENPYAPRNYGEFYAVLLFHRDSMQVEEHDPFHPYIGPRMVTPDSPSPYQWTFDRNTSPVFAAEAVAAKLRELGVTRENCFK